MFRLVDVREVDTEERVREISRARWVREVEVYDEDREQGHDEVESQVAESVIRVVRPDDAVAVGVKVRAVLLQDGLVTVVARPAAVLRAIGALQRACEIGASSA